MWAMEVEKPLSGWTRLVARYRTKRCAQSWITFVRAAWHGLPIRLIKVLREAVAWIDNAVGLLQERAVPVLQAIQQKK